jgi:hypothetical protein
MTRQLPVTSSFEALQSLFEGLNSHFSPIDVFLLAVITALMHQPET